MRIKLSLFITVLLASIVCCWAYRANTPLSTVATITLNPNTTYQTMTGWEATLFAGQVDEADGRSAPPPYVNANPAYGIYGHTMLDKAVNLGLNRVRLEVKCSAENTTDWYDLYLRGQITYATWRLHREEMVNDDGDPSSINAAGFKWVNLDFGIDTVLLPLKQRVEANGEHLFINANYVCFDPGGPVPSLHNANPQEYAEFVLATYQHLQSKYGWVPDSWEVMLEPDNGNTGWNGTRIGQAVVAAGQRLQSHGFTPRFVVPGCENASNAPSWFDAIIAVPGALPFISEISYHRYDQPSASTISAIATRGMQNNVGTSMLEWWNTRNTFSTLHEDLTVGRNSAWQKATLGSAYPDNGGEYFHVDMTNPSNPIVLDTPQTPYLRQYFKYVRSGAVRINAATDNPTFDPIAFRNNNGKYVVIVKADSDGSISVHNLPAGTYGIFYTTNSASNVNASDQSIGAGEIVTASIPAPGVLTVYAKSLGNPTPTPTPTPPATPTPTPSPTPTQTPTPTPTPTPTATPSPTTAPIVLTEENSQSAIALNAATFVTGPFNLTTEQNLGSEKRTSVALFVTDLELLPGDDTSVLMVQAEDFLFRTYTLPLWYVGKVPGYDWLIQLNVRLPVELANSGDIWVTVSFHGLRSNRALIRMRPIGTLVTSK